MRSSVTRILKALNAPESTSKRDWDVIESQMETRLPKDYKELIDRMGGGAYIDKYIYILEPDCRSKWYDLVDFTDEINDTNEKIWKTEGKPAELLEVEGSFVIPWANTDNGDNFFWRCLPKQNPNNWTVLLNQGQDGTWEHHDMKCTDFLDAWLGNRIQSEILIEDFPLSPHVFESFNPTRKSKRSITGRSSGVRKPKRRLRKRYVRNGIPLTRPRRRSRVL